MPPRARLPRAPGAASASLEAGLDADPNAQNQHASASSTRSTAKLTAYFAVAALGLYLLLSKLTVATPFVATQRNPVLREYLRREPILLTVKNLTTDSGKPPLDYYEAPVCRYSDRAGSGDPIPMEPFNSSEAVLSSYMVQVRYTEFCRIPCRKDYLNQEDMKAWKMVIDGGYRPQMYVHNIPVVSVAEGGTNERGPYIKGYPLGYKLDGEYYINNHVFFEVEFHHEPQTDLHTIVGVYANALSVQHQYKGVWNPHAPLVTTCLPDEQIFPTKKSPPQAAKYEADVIFSYNVHFKEVSRADLPKGYPR